MRLANPPCPRCGSDATALITVNVRLDPARPVTWLQAQVPQTYQCRRCRCLFPGYPQEVEQ